MKSFFVKCTFGVLLLGAAATSPAQSIWNYFITDAGSGNSLLTWSVSGDLATPPGSTVVVYERNFDVLINAPGIFADSFAGSGGSQDIPTPDGSYFETGDIYFSILLYSASNATGSGSDSFGLQAPAPPRGPTGGEFSYVPGTQSALIPIDFSNFNPGTYQSQESEFSSPLTVNLTIGAVPEPSTLVLAAFGSLSSLLLVLHRKLF